MQLFVIMILMGTPALAEIHDIIIYNHSAPSQKIKSSPLTSKINILSRKNITLSSPKTAIFMKKSKQDSVDIARVDSPYSAEKTCELLMKHTGISLAEPNYPLDLFSDPDINKQHYMLKDDLYQIWSLDVNAPVVVAVIDTGIDFNHPDLKHAIVNNPKEQRNNKDDDGNGYRDDQHGYSWIDNSPTAQDDHGHGTHLSGIIAAQKNGVGITGVHPEAKIMPLKVFNKQGRGTQLNAALAIYYAVYNGADIINCSWGYLKQNTVLKQAIQAANKAGVIVLAAVGNASSKNTHYPAGFPDVLGVSAINENYEREWYSNYGPNVDFAMLGTNMYSTLPSNGYGLLTGTSQSTALLSGIIARLKAYSPKLTRSDITSILQQASTSPVTKRRDKGYGVPSSIGVLSNFNMAAKISLNQTDSKSPSQYGSASSDIQVLSNVLNAPNPVKTGTTTVFFTSEQANLKVIVEIYTLDGLKLLSKESTSINGDNSIQLNLSSLHNGVYPYVVRLKDSGYNESHKGLCAVLK